MVWHATCCGLSGRKTGPARPWTTSYLPRALGVFMQRIAGGILVLAALAAGLLYWRGNDDAGRLQIESAPVERRDLSRIVTSSGRIAPLVMVEVGSQLSGQVASIEADFNDRVAAGALLARLDPQTFQTRVREAEAALEVAAAQVTVSEATILRSKAELNAAERSFARAQALRERGTFSAVQFDEAETALEVARAALAVAEANLRNAKATLQQRDATGESARVDLERTFIRSPIDGIVVDRQIDAGQTVAASLNAPILFLIAQDLARIQIEAQVDEADIGRIEVGQPVTFDVDAWPDQSFRGTVTQVRLAATAEQNVVTYTVVIEADNPRQRLLPGMTANVSIVTGTVAAALTVPAAALRFAPRGTAEALVVDGSAAGSGSGAGAGGGPAAMVERLTAELELDAAQQAALQEKLSEAFRRLRGQMQAGGAQPDVQGLMRRALADVLTAEQLARFDALQSQRGGGREGGARGTIWIETDDGRLRSQRVVIGLSDGQFTEVTGADLAEGTRVVLRVREPRP
ncbi:MAG: efflux RND transporter periplasmic adaptor subunit [Gammaproteobacteria bacterium]|nr:efflux RND transporter periplasmic adaptor subunit [Gammaproteobacteria bacterium]